MIHGFAETATDTPPKDAIASCAFRWTGPAMSATPQAPRSPWQNGYAERLIGSIRRECLDHVIAICGMCCAPTCSITTAPERTYH
jgi:hypothetical protein